MLSRRKSRRGSSFFASATHPPCFPSVPKDVCATVLFSDDETSLTSMDYESVVMPTFLDDVSRGVSREMCYTNYNIYTVDLVDTSRRVCVPTEITCRNV